MNALDIKRNLFTGGQYTVFQKGKDFFYADRSHVPDIGIETMIFPSNAEGEVTSWTEVYADRSRKSLKECVNEFLNQ